jgi:hypothetical protein
MDVDGQAFTREYFSSLVFKSVDDAADVLCPLALQVGFRLCRQDRSGDGYARFYCHMAGISKGKKKSRKTDCRFRIAFSRTNDRFRATIMDLDHNHPLVPDEQRSIESEVKDRVKNLKKMASYKQQLLSDILKVKRDISVKQLTNQMILIYRCVRLPYLQVIRQR